MKVSVIVAVYNIESYIGRCIKSLVNQTLDDVEIIIVNDKSTDQSRNVCEQFINEHNNIIIIDNEDNVGLSCSRNNGLKKASGKYVMFIDGDDYLETNTLERLYICAEERKCDAVLYANQYNKKNGEVIYRMFD